MVAEQVVEHVVHKLSDGERMPLPPAPSRLGRLISVDANGAEAAEGDAGRRHGDVGHRDGAYGRCERADFCGVRHTALLPTRLTRMQLGASVALRLTSEHPMEGLPLVRPQRRTQRGGLIGEGKRGRLGGELFVHRVCLSAGDLAAVTAAAAAVAC